MEITTTLIIGLILLWGIPIYITARLRKTKFKQALWTILLFSLVQFLIFSLVATIFTGSIDASTASVISMFN